MESYIDFIKKYNEKSVTSSENDSEFDNFLKGGANKNILGGFPKVYEISDTNKLNKKEYASDISNILNSKIESPFIAVETGGYSEQESIGLPDEFVTESIPSEVKYVEDVNFDNDSVGGMLTEETIEFPEKIEYENVTKYRTIKEEFNKDIVMVDSDATESESLKFPEYLEIESEDKLGGNMEDSDTIKFPEFIEVESEELLGGDDRDCGCEEEQRHCPDCGHDDMQDGGNLENSDSIKFPEFIEVESEELLGGDDRDCGCEEYDENRDCGPDCNHDDMQDGGNLENSESIKFPEFIEVESEELTGGEEKDKDCGCEEGDPKCSHRDDKCSHRDEEQQNGGSLENSDSIKFPEFIEVESDELIGGGVIDSDSIKFPEFIEFESEEQKGGANEMTLDQIKETQDLINTSVNLLDDKIEVIDEKNEITMNNNLLELKDNIENIHDQINDVNELINANTDVLDVKVDEVNTGLANGIDFLDTRINDAQVQINDINEDANELMTTNFDKLYSLISLDVEDDLKVVQEQIELVDAKVDELSEDIADVTELINDNNNQLDDTIPISTPISTPMQNGGAEDTIAFPEFLEIESESGLYGLKNKLGGAESDTVSFPDYLEIESENLIGGGNKIDTESETLKFPDYLDLESDDLLEKASEVISSESLKFPEFIEVETE